MAEGVTSWQVVDSLKKADFLTGALETVPPEGTLAPGGYEPARGTERVALINEIISTAIGDPGRGLGEPGRGAAL